MRPLNHGQCNFHWQAGGCVCYGGKDLTSGWSFIGCIRLGIKLIHPRWQPRANGRKARHILFFFTLLPQLPTLLAGPSVTELFILCPTLPFLSDTHYAHGSFILAHKPTKTCYITVSELQWKKQNNNTTQSGHRSPALVCTGTVFHGKAPRITRMRPKLRHMQEIRAGKSWLSHIICTHVRKERKNQKALHRAFPCLHE